MALAEEIARAALLLHPDPHSIFGAHPEDGTTLLRVLRPGATKVAIVVDGEERATTKVHPRGVFEAHAPKLALPLDGSRFEVVATDAAGAVTRSLDPYFFTPTIGDLDLHLFAEGTHDELHRHLGAHLREHQGARGTSFSVWAPNAASVRVVGDFNAWKPDLGVMRKFPSGVWEIFVPGVAEGALYKFEVLTHDGTKLEKSDPFGREMEVRPGTASRVTTAHHVWNDGAWMEKRKTTRIEGCPMAVYEVHLQSWKKKPRARMPGEPPLLPEQSQRWLTYRELADELGDYVEKMGFTHVELLPVMEHPYDGSWGYQVSGYFAPTSRLGTPDDFRAFVDRLHQRGIGVLLDWVPAHFPKDAQALGRFDGTPLFEHADPRRGEHRHWGTFIFDYGRNEVRNFLVASALYWLEEFHVDGLRVDAVASMLYLDYSARDDHDWVPNIHGGNENLEAVAFLRDLTDRIHAKVPGALVIAEESTTWPGVTRPTYAGGLGFDLKWNMGWMHDTLKYFSMDPFFRSFHHQLLTFGLMYAYSERFMLPLSHDEVVHLKKSLYGKMDGDPWRKRASLRALFGYMWSHPGKKLLFMGGETGQKTEWNADASVEWSALPENEGVQRFVRDLNALYRQTPALHELDDDPRGFLWIDANDAAQSIVSFIRFPKSKLKRRKTGKHVVFVANFTPIRRERYRIGVPRASAYLEVLNSDAAAYGGTNIGNMGRVMARPIPSHGHEQSVELVVPPLGCVFLVPEDVDEPSAADVEAERLAIEAEAQAKAKAMVREPTAGGEGGNGTSDTG